jgi:hypothetical protein
MLSNLPRALADVVVVEKNMLGEEFPALPVDALPRVLSVFSSLGVPCTEEQVLIVTAAGYSPEAAERMR